MLWDELSKLYTKLFKIMFIILKTFASLRREIYQDDLELCWNCGVCKSAYTILEFGCTYNYKWWN